MPLLYAYPEMLWLLHLVEQVWELLRVLELILVNGGLCAIHLEGSLKGKNGRSVGRSGYIKRYILPATRQTSSKSIS